MDRADRALLESTVGDALASATVPGSADAALTGLGWLEMLEAEPTDAIDVVFTALGTTNGAATALDDVVVAALGIAPRADLAVLLPPFGAWQPPGRYDDGDFHAHGLATPRASTAREILVVCRSGAETSAVLVARADAEASAVHGVDPDAGFHIVRAAHSVEGERIAVEWDPALALGRRAVAHQISGACRTMLTLARTHALERFQFGRPIASFQAVRHRLAEALVAIEALEATLAAAADEPTAMTAALAKATAGRTGRIVATHCQQVLAGIGFTTDHPFHRFLKRTMTLDGLFGAADEIAVDLGRALLATRRVPKLIEL